MKNFGDIIFENISKICAFLVLFLILGVFIVLFINAKIAIEHFGFDFLVDLKWAPNLNIFGGYSAIFGSLSSTLIALIIAIPISIGIAIFLSQIAKNKIKYYFGICIELLAAIPSVVYGMWGLFYFAPVVRTLFGGYGIGLLTAGIILAIMVIPFIASISRDAMNTTPDILIESAYALGATKFDIIKDIIIPYAKVGIIGSFILAFGRAIGETMAVTFVMGNVHKIPKSITDVGTSIPVTLANEFNEADTELYYSSLFYLALILFIISFFSIVLAKFVFLRKVNRAL